MCAVSWSCPFSQVLPVPITRKPFSQHTLTSFALYRHECIHKFRPRKLHSKIPTASIHCVLMKNSTANFFGRINLGPWRETCGPLKNTDWDGGDPLHFQSHILKQGIVRTDSIAWQSLKTSCFTNTSSFIRLEKRRWREARRADLVSGL